MPDSCTKVGVLGVRQCNGIIETGPQPTPVAMVRKNFGMLPQNFGVGRSEGDRHAGFATRFSVLCGFSFGFEFLDFCHVLVLLLIQSCPKKRYPDFNFAITSVNAHRF